MQQVISGSLCLKSKVLLNFPISVHMNNSSFYNGPKLLLRMQYIEVDRSNNCKVDCCFNCIASHRTWKMHHIFSEFHIKVKSFELSARILSVVVLQTGKLRRQREIEMAQKCFESANREFFALALCPDW